MMISARKINLLMFLYTFMMMLVALVYFQEYLGLLPCPLCVTQRMFTLLVGGIALMAYIHRPGRLGVRIYALGTLLAASGGISISLRQVWLQHLPADQVPACGPTLNYLIDYFPFQDVVRAMFFGDGDCAEVKWQLLGLSIAGWTAVAFALLILTSLYQLTRKQT